MVFSRSFKLAVIKTLKVGAILAAIIFVQAMLFWIFEGQANPEASDPFEAFWFIIIYLVSGAEIVPATTAGRIVCTMVVIEGLAVLSIFIAAVASYIMKGGTITKGKGFKNHIILCGPPEKARRIILQLRSPDIKTKRQIVYLSKEPKNPLPEEDIHFISGDPTKDEDMRKAGVMSAYAAIILADEKSDNPDAQAILTTLTVESLNRDVYTCVEILDPENERHLAKAKVDEVICPSKFGEYLILQSCVSPGLSKMFSSLLTFGEGDEVYRIPLPNSCVGKSFKETFVRFGREKDIILLAVERGGEININPKGEFRLKKGDFLFVISEEEPVAESI
ncbi:MAG: NAD-binding protein [Candidatus Hadarchaeum sp.]|uniref:potassium channel family protein n=1 Tax=Candidatus Hadarchaeum sp. TaxID=2883567 RepID=UPI00317AA6DF